MRDLDQAHERNDADSGRSPSLVSVLLLVSFGAVFAAGIWIGQRRSDGRHGRDEDPLARLDGSEESTSQLGETLVFHDALPVPSPPSKEVNATIAPVASSIDAPSTQVVPSGVSVPDPSDRHDSPTLRPPEPPERDPVPRGRDGVFTLHVASYGTEDDAIRFRDELRREGHRAFIVRTEVEERGMLFRVRIGPFESLAEAQRYRLDFESKMGIPTFIVRRELPEERRLKVRAERRPEPEPDAELEDS